jgi:mRNA interferase HicA
MKCSDAYRILIQDGWFPVSQRGSHIKMCHLQKTGFIIFPNHGSSELAKGTAASLFKKAEIK